MVWLFAPVKEARGGKKQTCPEVSLVLSFALIVHPHFINRNFLTLLGT